jgi:hypothetical protein
MAIRVGIWIDRKKSYIVTLQEEEETLTSIESNVEGHPRLSGGSRSRTPYGPQGVASEKKFEERHRQHLQKYYQKIIPLLQEADRIFIFGPGKAKLGLEKELKKSKELSSKIAAVETVDKMTENQIKAHVRKFFHVKK